MFYIRHRLLNNFLLPLSRVCTVNNFVSLCKYVPFALPRVHYISIFGYCQLCYVPFALHFCFGILSVMICSLCVAEGALHFCFWILPIIIVPVALLGVYFIYVLDIASNAYKESIRFILL